MVLKDYINKYEHNFLKTLQIEPMNFMKFYRTEDVDSVSMEWLSILLGINKDISLSKIEDEDKLKYLLKVYNLDIKDFYFSKIANHVKCLYVHYGFIIEIHPQLDIEEIFKYLKDVIDNFNSYFFNEKSDLQYLFKYASDTYKINVLNFFYNFMNKDDRCNVVKEIFKFNDYRASSMPLYMIEEAYADTLEQLPDEYLTLYRGEGSKSISYKEAYSWSLDLDVAKFFATRAINCENDLSKVNVYKIKVSKKHLIGFINDEEQEVLVNPKIFLEDIKVEVIPFDKSKAYQMPKNKPINIEDNIIQKDYTEEDDSNFEISSKLLDLLK